ncbi:MAG: zinc metallopeptidase [Sarcina sp.]
MLYPIFDPTYIILIPAILLSFWAQIKVNGTFNKYNKVPNRIGYTGAQVASIIMNKKGIYDVKIEAVNGKLSDHYDPVNKVVRLSQEVYYGNSLAALGVAAHEIGHVQQDFEGYGALRFRHTLFPVVNISNSLSWVLFFVGLIFSIKPLITVGIILFSIVVLFQLVTLPVEFNASNRAIKDLEGMGILASDEVIGAKNVLSAAALTYVAATLMAISQLIRLIAISNRNSD